MIINFRNSETSRIQKINLDAYKLTRTPMIKKKKKKPASAYLIIRLASLSPYICWKNPI
jgi:hypothetical protein